MVFHHVQNIGFCSVNLCAGKNGMPDRQACEPQIFFGIMTADANPEITPGIHHVQNIGFCSVNLCAGKNGMPDRQACEPQIFFGIMTADANPEITPGIYVICLIKCQFARMNEKPLSLFEQIGAADIFRHHDRRCQPRDNSRDLRHLPDKMSVCPDE